MALLPSNKQSYDSLRQILTEMDKFSFRRIELFRKRCKLVGWEQARRASSPHEIQREPASTVLSSFDVLPVPHIMRP